MRIRIDLSESSRKTINQPSFQQYAGNFKKNPSFPAYIFFFDFCSNCKFRLGGRKGHGLVGLATCIYQQLLIASLNYNIDLVIFKSPDRFPPVDTLRTGQALEYCEQLKAQVTQIGLDVTFLEMNQV